MTLVCCDTPTPRTARTAPTPAVLARTVVGRLATHLNGLARGIADRRRIRRDGEALAALPLDLRKDLGWPAGDMRR